jgi:O-succinylbenzoate synthase
MGHTGFGEAAPLHGFSTESFDDVRKELSGIAELAAGFEEAKDLQTLRDFIGEIKFTSSVRFAIEQAVISMLLKKDPSLLQEILSVAKSVINVNAVIGIENNAIEAIRHKVEKGYITFKIKVGRNDFKDDLNLVKIIRAEFGKELKIRLDANGKWSLEEAKSNLEKLSHYNIEYIEEPCSGIENLIALSTFAPLPVAIDESLKNLSDAYGIIEETKISFLIIKPMISGGFFETLEIIARGALKEKNIIISSSFETPLGKSLLVLLSSLTHHSYAHGLDTANLFEEEVHADPYKVEAGKIFFSPAGYPPQFNFGEL